MPPATPGYSGKPLVEKLGFKSGFHIALIAGPPGFPAALGKLPDDVKIEGARANDLDAILFFADRAATLEQQMPRAIARLTQAGMLWIAWPKKASKLESDLDFDAVQRVGLDAGLVDNKSCAIDEDWQAVRFVYRKVDRPTV